MAQLFIFGFLFFLPSIFLLLLVLIWFDSWPLCVTSVAFVCLTFFFLLLLLFSYVRLAYSIHFMCIAQAHLIKRKWIHVGWKENRVCESARMPVYSIPCIGANEISILYNFSNSFFVCGEFDVKMLRPVSFWYNSDIFQWTNDHTFCFYENLIGKIYWEKEYKSCF